MALMPLPENLLTLGRAIAFLALGSMAAVPQLEAQAPPEIYRVSEVLSARGFDSIRVISFNNLGQFVGAMDGPGNRTHAFLWDIGVNHDLGTFGGAKSLACGINDSTQIVGAYLTNNTRHAFLWQKGAIQDLGEIDNTPKLGFEGELYQGGPGQIYWTPQIAINNRGQVTGHLGDRSFLLSNGTLSFLGVAPSGQNFYAEQVNDRGEILGRAVQSGGGMHPFLWREGQFVDFDQLVGSHATPTAFNGRGEVIGTASSALGGSIRAFVWANNSLRWLAEAADDLHPLAINNAGEVVGYARNPAGGQTACLWKAGRLYDLSPTLDLPAPWQPVAARGINDRGQIWLTATNGLGPIRYFLLTPAIQAEVSR